MTFNKKHKIFLNFLNFGTAKIKYSWTDDLTNKILYKDDYKKELIAAQALFEEKEKKIEQLSSNLTEYLVRNWEFKINKLKTNKKLKPLHRAMLKKQFQG